MTSGQCTQCREGYYPNPNKTLECIVCETIPGCYTCSRTERRCFQCQAPMGPDGNGNCVNCTDKQYWENGTCHNNTEGCINQLNSTECIKCSDNYFLLNNICVLKNHSETCSKETTHSCEICENGMMIGGSCKKNVNNCKYYSTQVIHQSINKCHQCNTNYYLTNNNETCSPIPSNEILYIESDKHYKCIDGYYLNKENKCIQSTQTDINSNVSEYHADYFYSYTCQNERILDI